MASMAVSGSERVDLFRSVTGEAKVLTKGTREWVPITIEGQSDEWKSGGITYGRGRYRFIAYITESRGKREIGNLTCYWLRNFEDGTWGGEYYTRRMTDEDWECRYGLEESAFKTNRLMVERLYSYQQAKFRGVGSALMQAAMEWGDMDGKDCRGHIYLDAIGSSHKFYYNLGMRTLSAERDALIKDLPSVCREEDFGSCLMYMSSEGRERYAMRVADGPIFKAQV